MADLSRGWGGTARAAKGALDCASRFSTESIEKNKQIRSFLEYFLEYCARPKLHALRAPPGEYRRSDAHEARCVAARTALGGQNEVLFFQLGRGEKLRPGMCEKKQESP